MGQAKIRKQNGTSTAPNGKNNRSSKNARYFLRQLTGLRKHLAEQTRIRTIRAMRGEK